MNFISWDDFEKIDIRVGQIQRVETFEAAHKPAYKLWIDFGPGMGIKPSSAQITAHYEANDLIGKQIIAIINFPPKQIANFFSECLVLGVYDEKNEVVLLTPDKPLLPGLKIG